MESDRDGDWMGRAGALVVTWQCVDAAGHAAMEATWGA